MQERAKKIFEQACKLSGSNPVKITSISENFDNNCENCIGAVAVPVGLAGPITFNGNIFFAPLATTEACLVASVNRGCKALGEIRVKSDFVGITRSPVFKVKDPKDAEFYLQKLTKLELRMQEIVSKTSRFTKIIKFEVEIVEEYLYIKFYFETGDAMGMNMITIATNAISTELLEDELDAKLIAVSSNFCSDKKISLKNIEKGRGFRVYAEANISESVLNDILKTDSARMIEAYLAKIVIGSDLADSISHNSHIANVVSALFLATGQDAAHIPESSLGETKVEKIEDGIKISVFLPTVICGTIGGGTRLPFQHEALILTGINLADPNVGNSKKSFAELVGAVALAGELSLLSSISENSLADAHKKYRNK